MSIRFAALGLALLPVCALGAPASPSSIPANISVEQLGHLAASRAGQTPPAAAGSIFGNSTSTGGENIGGPISTVQKVQTLTTCLPAGTQNVPAGSLGGYRLSCSAATPGGTPTIGMCVDSAPASCTTLSTATLPPASNAGGAMSGTLQDGVKVKLLWKSTGGTDYALGATLTQALAIDPETMQSQGQKAVVASTADSGYALTTAVPPVDTNTGKVMVGAPPASSSTVAANESTGEAMANTAQTCMGKQSVAIHGGNPVYTCDGKQSIQAQLNSSSGGCPKGSTNCYDLSTEGQQNQPAEKPDPNAMNKALQAHGMLLAIKKGLSGTNPPAVFGGTDGQCERDVAYFTDCCSLSLKKTGSGFQKCSDEEVKLAAAKRAGLAYHIADHCCVSVLGVCTDNKSNYCVFDSMLALIIQEQGRAQLAQMAAAGAAKEASVNETFAPFAGSGHWLPFTVNGNDVWAWQWPAACADPATASTVVNDGDCPATPGQIQWAACSAGSGCTAPTTPPPALSSSTGVSFLATDRRCALVIGDHAHRDHHARSRLPADAGGVLRVSDHRADARRRHAEHRGFLAPVRPGDGRPVDPGGDPAEQLADRRVHPRHDRLAGARPVGAITHVGRHRVRQDRRVDDLCQPAAQRADQRIGQSGRRRHQDLRTLLRPVLAVRLPRLAGCAGQPEAVE
jgi:hypothetical protein